MKLLPTGAEPAPPLSTPLPPPDPRPPAADWGPTSAVYVESYRLMLRIAFSLTGSREAAEDAVHDAFCTVGPKLAVLDDPVPYLRVAVVNRCRSLHRRSVGESERLRRATAGAAVDSRMESELVEFADALDKLPFAQRAAIVMRFLDDLPDEEIAATLDCRRATVRSHIHRGLAQLRKDLS